MPNACMPDPIFANPQLVDIYDAFDGPRHDLDAYVNIARELKARTVLDLGCGTGCFACRLADAGFHVIGVDPAAASIDFARRKPQAEHVRWIVGDAASLPPLQVDLAVMTGNVAQVFLTDEAWERNLIGLRRALQPQGHLVFETRNPAQQAWLEWTREKTYQRLEIPNIGTVASWCGVLEAKAELVEFRWTYVFEKTGTQLESHSTLRFRDRAAIAASLARTGFSVEDVRDAPDRPGKEFVFIARKK